MNTQAKVESSLREQVTAPAAVPASRLFYWQVRRELWENRSLYIAPLVAAGVVLCGFLLSMITLPHRLRAVSFDPWKQHGLLEQPYEIAAGMIMVTAFIVGVFYSLESLQSERRDRSILFWKSLPVSDLTTVLAKASIPLLLLPLIAFAVLVATEWIMVLLNTLVLVGSGVGTSTLWSLPLFQKSLMWLYHMVTVHGLWYAPLYGWLLLVSAWSKRLAILWAALPPIAIGFVEKIAFNTSYFGDFMKNWITGGPAGGDPLAMSGHGSMDLLSELTPGKFLLSPGLWIGFAVAAAFLAGAVRLRRYREPN